MLPVNPSSRGVMIPISIFLSRPWQDTWYFIFRNACIDVWVYQKNFCWLIQWAWSLQTQVTVVHGPFNGFKVALILYLELPPLPREMIPVTFCGDHRPFAPFIRAFMSHIIPNLTRCVQTKFKRSLSLKSFSITEFWSSKVSLPVFDLLWFLVCM